MLLTFIELIWRSKQISKGHIPPFDGLGECLCGYKNRSKRLQNWFLGRIACKLHFDPGLQSGLQPGLQLQTSWFAAMSESGTFSNDRDHMKSLLKKPCFPYFWRSPNFLAVLGFRKLSRAPEIERTNVYGAVKKNRVDSHDENRFPSLRHFSSRKFPCISLVNRLSIY